MMGLIQVQEQSLRSLKWEKGNFWEVKLLHVDAWWYYNCQLERDVGKGNSSKLFWELK